MSDPKTDHERTMEAAVMIMAAFRSFAGLREHAESELVKEQRKANARHNRLESFRTLLAIFEWRYLLLPVGIRDTRQFFYDDLYAQRVTTRSLHIFGIRIARWIVKSSLHRLIPEPQKARMKFRPSRRKPFRKLHR